jgi:hypothetical protein
MREMLGKQQKEAAKITNRIALKKEEVELKAEEAKEIRAEISSTLEDMKCREIELEAKLKDKEFIRNYLRQQNPTKK